MRTVTLNYQTLMPEDRIFAFARKLGYSGEDLEEATRFIHEGFLNHVTPWMISLIDIPSTLEIREAFKKKIACTHIINLPFEGEE